VQGALLGGLLRGFAGVGLAIVGARLLRRGD
jgi:hypothetical protein